MPVETIHSLLHQHLPAPAVGYCLHLWQQYPFELRLRKSRQTKVGDFTYRPGRPLRITLNADLHPLVFLITYVHEVAHLVVHHQHGSRVEAHGRVWKQTFQQLLEPLLTSENFPPNVLRALKRHMQNPKASSFSDTALTEALRQHDPRAGKLVLLSHLPVGSVFGLNGRWFTKGKHQRTRALCRELKSKRNYLVPLDAPIQSAQLALL